MMERIITGIPPTLEGWVYIIHIHWPLMGLYTHGLNIHQHFVKVTPYIIMMTCHSESSYSISIILTTFRSVKKWYLPGKSWLSGKEENCTKYAFVLYWLTKRYLIETNENQFVPYIKQIICLSRWKSMTSIARWHINVAASHLCAW